MKFDLNSTIFNKIHIIAGKTLTEANDYMTNWIVEKLGITESSNVLDIGCGKGKYIAEIAQKSGA